MRTIHKFTQYIDYLVLNAYIYLNIIPQRSYQYAQTKYKFHDFNLSQLENENQLESIPYDIGYFQLLQNSGHLIKGRRGGRSGVAVLTKRDTNQFSGDNGNVLHLDLGDHLEHSNTKLLTPKIYAFLSKFYFKNY